MFYRNIRCVFMFVALAAIMAVSLRSARALDDGPTLVTLRDADNGVSIALQADQVLVIDIEQNASTGFMWEVTGIDAANLKQLETSFVPAPARLDGKPWVGAPGRQVLRFAALKAGTSMLTLAYRRSWEKDTPPERTYTAQVTGADPVSGAALAYAPAAPTMAQAGSLEPNASFIPEPGASEVLTPALNWCSTNNPLGRDVCSAVKNQGSCGSCWAFGTEGVVEAAIKKADGVERDTSEQYLVSCNVQGASCNGGWWAFGPSINQVPAGETNPGVRYESDFAYQASNAACNPPYAAHEVLVNSGSVALTVDAIKQAISDYGPVAAAICVGPAFSAYSSGIFATDEVTKCNGSVNHAIVLFGWDDTDGTWLLRNSWGPGWGQAGTMRIKWGTSKVGYGATYAVYNGPSANYNVAGFVRTPDGLGVAKATVSFTGSGARPSVTTNDSGYFIQTGFSNGTYSVTASATNYTITPTRRIAVVASANVANVNFTGTQAAQFHRISGYLLQPNGAGVSGATVSFTGTSNLASIKTDTYGFYSRDAVLSGTYTVTIAVTGYTISPTFRTTVVTTTDVLLPQFTGSRPTYTITGYILTTTSVGIPGVTVGFDDEYLAVTTNASGYWVRDGVFSGHPRVIPVKAGWIVSPTWKILTLAGNQNNINFSASPAQYVLSGTVMTADNVPINGATVSFGAVRPAVNTSADGYRQTGFLSGTVVVVTPTLSGYTFVPVTRQVTFGAADMTASFTGSPLVTLREIAGVVKDGSGNAVPNVNVSFGAARPSVETGSSGFFTQTGFPDGLYTLAPVLSGYAFSPPSRTFTLAGADKRDANFTATRLTYTITGRVTVNGIGVPATLSFGNAMTVSAGAGGYYTMAGLPNGEYPVGVSHPNSLFSPPARTVVINGASATLVDFAGALQTYCVSGYARWYSINTPIAGVSVAISGTTILNTLTDAQGLYQRCDVPYGEQRVTFSSGGITFLPESLDVTVIRDASNVDAAGYTDYFDVTGRVVDSSGNPMPNVTVNVLEWGYDDVTDASGYFTDYGNFTDVTFVPKRDGYTFSPSKITVLADGTDQSGLVFTATAVVSNSPGSGSSYALSGYVRDTLGAGVPGAMIYYQSGPNNIYLGTSGLGGLYVIQGIASGASLVLGASHPAYDFAFNYSISNISSDVTGLVYTGTQIADYLIGQAKLQGHYDAPNTEWWFGYPLQVELFAPGAAVPSATLQTTIDSWGYFVIPGVAPGNYDIRIKNLHSLSQKRLNVTVAANQVLRFDMLREGDVNDDDGVWYEDFDLMAGAFGACRGDARYSAAADIDDSGCVWGYDISLLTTNFGIGGKTASLAAGSIGAPAVNGATLRARNGVYNAAPRRPEVPAATLGRFTLTPSAAADLAVGDVFTVAIGVRAPNRGLDSVTAFLNFDPSLLEVVDGDGAPIERAMAAATLPLVVINTVDNGLGQVDLVMNRGLGSVPVTGNFELATLRFRLKQATAGTAITFDNPDPALALSDIDLEGYGYMNRSVSLPTVLVSSANHAPDAVADQYVAKKNTVLRVSAPGATANDADIDGDPYWLIYYYPPSHGQLTLYDDGSFVYTPTLGYVGADAFQYQGSDGKLESNWATVTLQVLDWASVYVPMVRR